MIELALLLAQPADAPIRLHGMLCHPNRLLVKLESRISFALLESAGVRVRAAFPQIGWAVVEAPKNRLQATKRALTDFDGVAQVTFDRAATPAYEPNDPMWPSMWHMSAINANLAWDHTFGGPQGVVAVIDTGVLRTHEDLAPNLWVNVDEIPGDSIDNDSNGYVDDVNGYDFAYDDPDPDDVYGHGTPCAGLAAAVQDNGLGVTGVAPRARIMCIKASTDAGYFYDSATVPAYLYAASNGARVLSMSYFSDRVSQAERDAIDYCLAQGVLPVAAAGNSYSVLPYYPAAYENTLSVAAVDTQLRKTSWSNYGSWVDVAAPGTALRSTSKNGAYTESFGGTSGATPHLAGLAALLFGANPSATPQDVRNAIEDTATPVNQAPYGEFCNYGIVDAEAAASAFLGTPAPARSPVVRYVSALGWQVNEVNYDADEDLRMRIYGRGFQTPNTVSAMIGGVPLQLMEQTRDWFEAQYVPPYVGPLEIRVNGEVVSTLAMPPTYRMCHPLVEASTPGAATIGGFLQTLNQDGVSLRCTRHGDGFIRMQATFRRVRPGVAMKLRIVRHFTAGTGTESIMLYDWSSGSYPYGSFATLHSGQVPLSPTLAELPIPESWRYIDPEGTMYLVIQTTDDMPVGAELRVDMAHVTADR